METIPANIEVIGNSLAIKWSNDEESFLEASILRTHSPSAENKGETDIFGNITGGEQPTEIKGISILKFFKVGNYAIRIQFSDGHSTGIFSWKLLKELETKCI